MSTILFKDLIDRHNEDIKNVMRWENYDLNDTIIAVTEQVKNDAINVLKRSYGRIEVETEILDELLNDVFLYFPSLLQQLSITRLIDSLGVVKDDTNKTVLSRNENLTNETEQSNLTNNTNIINDTTIATGETTLTGTGKDIRTDNTQTTTTATNTDNTTSTTTQESTTNIENISGIESTGTRNVSLSHNMPEQGLNSTGNFEVDEQGTPILATVFAQQANEGFSTSNPINSNETSTQTIASTDESIIANETTTNGTSTNTGTTTNDKTNAQNEDFENSTTSNATNTMTGSNETNTISSGVTTISETMESTTTNKQYAYEIKAFLETANSINAFKIWQERFYWIEGII